MNQPEHLTRVLHDRADDVHGTPLTLDDVRGRARSIRRRRAGGAVAAVAVVAALATPVALLSGHDEPRSPEPAPSPTRAVDPQHGLPFIQGHVITYTDGPAIPLVGLGGARVQQFTPLSTDRYVVSVLRADAYEVDVLDGTGGLLYRAPIGAEGALVATPDRSAVAWVTPNGTVQLLDLAADGPRSLGRAPGAASVPVAITGDCDGYCEVVGHGEGDDSGPGSSWAAGTDLSVRDLPTATGSVVDATTDGSLVATLDRYAADDIHVCGGVYDEGAGDYLWQGCEDNRYAFSPDGTLVATTFDEGAGPTRIDLRDSRSGAAVAGAAGGWISSWAWEDDTHLLAVQVMDDGETSLLRLGPDGNSTLLDGLHTDTDERIPAIILPSP